MKVMAEPTELEAGSFTIQSFFLPQGIVGFPSHTRAQLIYDPKHLPFLSLQLDGPSGRISFVVIEPQGFVPGYEPEIFENDAAGLGLQDAADVKILTILTMNPESPLGATVNLVGPIIVNRRTGIGRQLVIANYARYRARHPLLTSRSATAA